MNQSLKSLLRQTPEPEHFLSVWMVAVLILFTLFALLLLLSWGDGGRSMFSRMDAYHERYYGICVFGYAPDQSLIPGYGPTLEEATAVGERCEEPPRATRVWTFPAFLAARFGPLLLVFSLPVALALRALTLSLPALAGLQATRAEKLRWLAREVARRWSDFWRIARLPIALFALAALQYALGGPFLDFIDAALAWLDERPDGNGLLFLLLDTAHLIYAFSAPAPLGILIYRSARRTFARRDPAPMIRQVTAKDLRPGHVSLSAEK